MTALYPIQDSFVRGEISPRLHVRASLDLYRAALSQCVNYITLPHGGIRKRGGTYFAGEVKTSSTATRLIPFIFSPDQAYALEVGNLYIRVYAYGQRVGSVEVVTPWATADIWDLSFYQSGDVMWICHGSYEPRTLTREAHTTWTLATFQVEDGPYLETNTTSTTLTPASTGNLTEIAGTAASTPGFVAPSTGAVDAWDRDNGTFLNINYRSGETSWTFGAGTYVCDAYYIVATINGDLAPIVWKFEGYNGATWVTLDSQPGQIGWAGGEARFFKFNNTTAYSAYRLVWTAQGNVSNPYTQIAEIGIHQSAITQTAFNLTASSTTGINKGVGFKTTDVGRQIRLLGSDNRWRWARIIARTSSTVVTIQLYEQALPDLTPIVNWRLGAWCTEEGWPDSVGLFEERLTFGKKFRINASKTGDLDNFALGEKDDDGLEFLQAGGGQANDIVWIADSDGALVIATSGGMRSLSGSGIDEALTPSSFKNRKSRTAGAARTRPIDAGRSFLYVGRSRRSLHELQSDQSGRFVSSDIGTVSEHIPKRGVVEIAYQEDPDPVMWYPLDTGELAGYTHQPDEAVRGMHRHIIGGSFGSGVAVVESCCVTPGQDAPDDVWLIVKRTINGSTKRYIEIMQPAFEYGALRDGFHVDCGLTYSGVSTNTISGLTHLAGQTVSVQAGSAIYTGLVVSGPGVVTLPGGAAVDYAHIGLPYISYAHSLELDVGGRDGSLVGRRKKVSELILSLFETDVAYLNIRSLLRGAFETARIVTNLTEPAKALFTGNIRVKIDDSWEGRGVYEILHNGPTPCTVRAVTPVFDGEP